VFGGDTFAAGSEVIVREPVRGDLIVAAGRVDVESEVDGDVVATGGRLRVAGRVQRSLYAAGGQLEVVGAVGRNARIAGGQVDLARSAEIAGNVSVAGGRVRLHGTVRGSVQAAGGRVLIDGEVAGDVNANGGEVELGPDARIAGTLRYRSREELRRDTSAQVTGGVQRLGLMPGAGPRDGRHEEREGAAEGPRGGVVLAALGGVWALGLMVLAALAIVALPAFSDRVAQTLRERTGMSLLLGFLLVACLPLALVLMIVTLVGIPLAMFVLLATLALLPVAYAASAIGLGDWALQRWPSGRREKTAWRIGAACAALLLLTLLGAIPVVGWLIGFSAMLAGLGALMLQVRQGRPPAPPASMAG
jgi:cytoskeletal protein CcmA (bactofilin family)